MTTESQSGTTILPPEKKQDSNIQSHEDEGNLYADYEKKIGFLKTFIRAYQSLPVPDVNRQSTDSIFNENLALRGIVGDAQGAFEIGFQRLKKLRVLRDESSNLTEDAPNTDEYNVLKDHSAAGLSHYIKIEEQIDELQGDPNINFLDYLESGVNKIIEFRDQLRNLQTQTGSILDENGWVIKSEKEYFLDVDGEMISPDAIQYGRSSLIYYVGKAEYQAIKNKYKNYPELEWNRPENAEFGMHIPGTNQVVINTQKFSLIDNSIAPGYYGPNKVDITDEMLNTVKHEEMHSFFVGFKNLHATLSPLSIRQLIFDMKSKMQIYSDRLKPDYQFAHADFLELEHRYTQFLKTQLYREIEKLINISNEEFLAELFSDPNRTDIPKDTFVNYHLKTKRMVENMFGQMLHADKNLKEIFETVQPKFDFGNTLETIKKLYRVINEHCPERVEDLDCVFIITPISEISKIEKLVDRWIEEAKAA